ncbi:hypothetical protein [Psychrobacillus sp. BL-248-WT-3]|uniref:hypothetical protein n=1 Tax=Psychrobacillus sp. BL-248-WT-3 TaxID=2725306 RepID=UPI001469F695|nr:hypothetical protein [Psychrobacillus sp. BL-248-WT-3]NME07521.1 hypothetical protein [Psychrobacillus sp. BL-248-WT-3]
MKEDHNLNEQLFITLFTAYIFSKVIHIALPTFNLLLLFTLMTVIITILRIFSNYMVGQVIVFTGIALQLTYVVKFIFPLSLIGLSVVGGTFLVLLITTSFLISEKATKNSINQSLLAASSISVMYLFIANTPLYLLLYLTYPVAVSCIYVSLSKKAEYGFTIVMINTSTSIAAAYLISLLLGLPMTDTILIATLISTLVVSFMYNDETKLVFMLGYQRFLTQKENLKKDIFILKRALLNVSDLTSKELLEAVNSLNDFKRERIVKNLSPGIITRFDLQERHKQLKATVWLLVFCAYVTYCAVAYYVSTISHDYLIAFLIFAPIYFLSVPYIISQILYKNLIRHVNQQFIIPYNKLIDKRDTLKEEITNLLLAKGYKMEDKDLSFVSATTYSTYGGRTDSETPNAF